MVWGIPFNAVLVAVGAYALIRGDRPERIGALATVVACLASAALRLLGLASWEAGGPTVMIDLVVAALFFWLGCRTTRFWPIWNFGLALAIISIDVAKLALPRVGLFVFATGQFVYAYLVLLTIAIGTFGALRAPRDPHHGFRPPCPTPSSPMHDSL